MAAKTKKPIKKKRKPVPYKVPVGRALVLRTCDADMTAHGGFKWPESGPVECPDWKAVALCGNGLHGLLWGEGDGSLVNWSDDAKWLVVEVEQKTIVELDGKVKFPRGIVVACGDRLLATSFLIEHLTQAAKVVGCSINKGNRSTLTGGDGSTLILKFYDYSKNKHRVVTLDVGEDGILPNTKYKLNAENKPEVVSSN